MSISMTRRAVIAGLASSIGSAAGAAPPKRSPRPLPRPPGGRVVLAPPVDDIVRRAKLGGKISFAIADVKTGKLLEVANPILPMPPASTAKAITALYALDTLGAGYRFATRLVATGPIRDGRLDGDLVMVGGGDPTLDTDRLGEMARMLKEAGIREVTGRFRVQTSALPAIRQIDPEQPAHVGYNPSVGGLNLNFNRVHFSWERANKGYAVKMEARGDRFRPAVTVAKMQVQNRKVPIYTYADSGMADEWTVARAALGKAGSRWLPVRRPGLYTAEVFMSLARSYGIVLNGDGTEARNVSGMTVVQMHSAPLRDIAADMLKFSTNLTAEVLGLTASRRLGSGARNLDASARRMMDWLDRSAQTRKTALKDHSGLNDDSRVTATDMVKALVQLGPEGALAPIMKEVSLKDTAGTGGVTVRAKTGTLHFVSGLAGYADLPGGRRVAFATFAADVPRREKLTRAQRDNPEGAAAWNSRAKLLQRELIGRWAVAYGS
ncbi:MAG: D-alanyl-D-alanine carboxypeptidase/D-alanyl-D-alanine-endopeptidase [Rhodobacteraceae bacterium]|nr:D-alanyl-D-alanine carboxypeptidase/D-alanyl-D-alanine-endopeptidase [Paracoccaceae bacterium]